MTRPLFQRYISMIAGTLRQKERQLYVWSILNNADQLAKINYRVKVITQYAIKQCTHYARVSLTSVYK